MKKKTYGNFAAALPELDVVQERVTFDKCTPVLILPVVRVVDENNGVARMRDVVGMSLFDNGRNVLESLEKTFKIYYIISGFVIIKL